MPTNGTPRTVYVDDQASFDALAPVFSGASVLAVDTESDSLYRYRERVCFLQVGVGSDAYLIDTLAIRDLGAFSAACANPAQVKVLHGADYDVSCLSRDFGVRFANLFDTMIASQLLGRAELGLAALVREFHGVELDKSLTTHDWGRRPLDDRYLRYLAEDVVFLTDLYDRLHADLGALDASEEAQIEFRRVAVPPEPRAPFDPEAFRRVKGARDLNRIGLSVLKELCFVRDRAAAAEDRPPFKILNNSALIDVACMLPRDLGELRRIQGFGDFVLRKIGAEVVDAVRRGVEAAETMELRPKPAGERPSDEQAAAVEALKAWRKEVAAREGRTTMLVLPNHLLNRVAVRLPRSSEELAEIPEFGGRRFARYAASIVEITRDPPPLDSSRRRRRDDGPAADES